MGASASRGRPLFAFGLAALLTLALDQAAKALALAHLSHASVPLLGGLLQLTLTRNTGAAFGLPIPGWAATAVSGVVSVVVLVYVAGGGVARSRLRAVALGLVLGGALGNIADRVRAGAVVDFIDLRIWPVFNVADIAITVGVGLLLLEVVRRR